MELWIVGRWMANTSPTDTAWEFMGVFDSKEKAVEACSQRTDFVGPALLNEKCPEETVYWDESFYPMEDAG